MINYIVLKIYFVYPNDLYILYKGINQSLNVLNKKVKQSELNE